MSPPNFAVINLFGMQRFVPCQTDDEIRDYVLYIGFVFVAYFVVTRLVYVSPPPGFVSSMADLILTLVVAMCLLPAVQMAHQC
jgi:hypothetical protein